MSRSNLAPVEEHKKLQDPPANTYSNHHNADILKFEKYGDFFKHQNESNHNNNKLNQLSEEQDEFNKETDRLFTKMRSTNCILSETDAQSQKSSVESNASSPQTTHTPKPNQLKLPKINLDSPGSCKLFFCF